MKTLRHLNLLGIVFLIFPYLASASMEREVQELAPGVWRIRIGQPESATPAGYRIIPPDLEGIGGCRIQ